MSNIKEITVKDKRIATTINNILVKMNKKTIEFAAGECGFPKGITQEEYRVSLEEALLEILELIDKAKEGRS